MNLGELAFGALQPSNAIFLLLAFGLVVSLRWRWFGTALVALGVVLLGGVGLLPVGEALLRPLEAEYPADPPVAAPTGIILLGGYITRELSPAAGDLALNEAGDRLVAAAVLARRWPQAKLILTDGTDDPTRPSGAEGSAMVLEALGISRDRMLLDTRALSTHDNAVFSRDLVQPQDGDTYLLVTSAWHMPRAMRTFAAAGWPGLVAYPVDYVTTYQALGEGPKGPVAKGLRFMDVAVREYLATAAYRLSGRLGG